jgi:hypothetical protein
MHFGSVERTFPTSAGSRLVYFKTVSGFTQLAKRSSTTPATVAFSLSISGNKQ